MANAIRHRGPDDAGAWVAASAGLALGHARLAILDLSVPGHQPMVGVSGCYVIAYNGEIYDHLELRTELGYPGAASLGHDKKDGGGGCLSSMPLAWAASTDLARAVSSSLLSVGWATAFFTEQLSKAPELGGVARAAMLKGSVAPKVLPGGRLALQSDDVLITFVERMLELQQRHHQLGGQTRSTSVGYAPDGNGRDRAKQVNALDFLARLDSVRPSPGQGRLDLLPKHQISQRSQPQSRLMTAQRSCVIRRSPHPQ